MSGRAPEFDYPLASRCAGVRAYQRHEPVHKIDLRLDANETPIAPGTLVAAVRPEHLGTYPTCVDLERLLALRLGVVPERLVVTAGADDALCRICLALCESGREALTTTPTFEMIARYAASAGARVVTVPWETGTLPVEAVVANISERTGVVFVVSPNNPTGLVASVDDLLAIRRSAPRVPIVLDAAYAEFADADITPAALEIPGVIVTRTLSKAWGLAGLRVGYAIGDPSIITALRAIGQPYAVSGPSVAMACAWLQRGEDAMGKLVAQVRRERTELIELLRSLGVNVHRGQQGNSVFARLSDAPALVEALARRGISVRSWTSGALAGAVRITLPGDAKNFDRLYKGVSEVLGAAPARGTAHTENTR